MVLRQRQRHESTAFGSGATATETSSSTFGCYAQATASGTSAIGFESLASAVSSNAFGARAKAEHANSVAIGANSATSAEKQVAFGKMTDITTFRSLAGIKDIAMTGALTGVTSINGADLNVGSKLAADENNNHGYMSIAFGAGATYSKESVIGGGHDFYRSCRVCNGFWYQGNCYR